MKMKINIENHSFSPQEIRIRSLGIYMMLEIWIELYFYKLITEPLSKNFNELSKQARKKGDIKGSDDFKACSKKLKRFLGVISDEESEQVLIFFVWLVFRKFGEWFEYQETATGLSNSLREFFLKEGAIKLRRNHILSKDSILFRKEMLKEYDKYNGRDILGPEGVYLFFTQNLANAIVFEKRKKGDNNFDEITHTSIIFYGLLKTEPLIIFIQKEIGTLLEPILKNNIDMTKELIENMSKAHRVDLSQVYGL